jgi:hypothetical protein
MRKKCFDPVNIGASIRNEHKCFNPILTLAPQAEKYTGCVCSFQRWRNNPECTPIALTLVTTECHNPECRQATVTLVNMGLDRIDWSTSGSSSYVTSICIHMYIGVMPIVHSTVICRCYYVAMATFTVIPLVLPGSHGHTYSDTIGATR